MPEITPEETANLAADNARLKEILQILEAIRDELQGRKEERQHGRQRNNHQ